MSRIAAMAVGLAALSGCETLNSLTEAIHGIAEPLVVVGVVVDVDLPDGASLVAGGTAFDSGTSFVGALGDTASIADGVGLAGAAVSIDGVAAEDRGDGSYVVLPGALEYGPGDTWSLDVGIDGAA